MSLHMSVHMSFAHVFTLCRHTGAFCPGGNRLWPLAGYWKPHETASFVEPCSPSLSPYLEQKCMGGPNCPNCCGVGYHGRRCAKCADGYYRRRRVCIPCTGKWERRRHYVYLGVFIGTFDLVLMFMHLDIVNSVIDIIMTLQMFRGIGLMGSAALPERILSIYEDLGVFTFDFEFLQAGYTHAFTHVDPRAYYALGHRPVDARVYSWIYFSFFRVYFFRMCTCMSRHMVMITCRPAAAALTRASRQFLLRMSSCL